MRSELFEKWYSDLCEKLNVDYCLVYLEDKGRYFKTQTHVTYMAWQHEQTKVEELQLKISEDSRILHNVIDIERKKNDDLQKRVDAAQDTLTELKEKSEALHHRWQVFSDSIALAEAEMIDMCVKEIEQALNTEVSHG